MVNNLNGNGGLINFLENNANVYPLDLLNIKKGLTNQWRECNSDMWQPQYLENEDLVIGHINMAGRNQPVFNVNYIVSFQQNNVNGMNYNDRYFATGYPGCRHYINNSPLNLVQNEGLAPLFITSALNSMINPVTMNINGSIDHRSPCAPGMSGGSLFHFLGANQVNIFGVITSGEDINEKGCHWH